MTERIKLAFIKHFNHEPIIVKSPGRINVIGEHTDYNEGYVLHAAISMAIYVAVSKRNDLEIHLYSESDHETTRSSVCEIIKSDKKWANHILGVADSLQKWGYNIGGFNLYIHGDLPSGVGLFSSSAVECATAYALIELFFLSVPKLDIPKIANTVEPSFASVFGKKNQAMLLDCRSMKHQYIPFFLEGYKLILLNTNVKHAVSETAYNRRRQQCDQGVEWIKAAVNKVNSLRDVNLKMLDKYVKHQDLDVYQKCKFVIEENQRVLGVVEQLKKGNLKALGQAMFETHDGLSRAYRVSCEELDFLVDSVKSNSDVLGAKMMGGGFGGCTLNLVKEEKMDLLIENLKEKYQKEFSKKLDAYIVEIVDGVSLIL